jgi:ketosteroid isomerase-like protein
MSQDNVDLVRSIYAAWEGGDFTGAEWADPEIEYVGLDGPDPGTSKGPAEMARSFRTWLSAWEEFRLEADEYRELDPDRVLVLDRSSGRGKVSGLNLGRIQSRGAWLFHIRDGRVTKMVRYMDRDRALEAVGLSE